MKSLIRLTVIFVILGFLAACGSDNKAKTSSSSSSSNPINSGDSSLDSFASRVNAQGFVTIPSYYNGIEYSYSDLENNHSFVRENDNGSIIRDDDGRNSLSAVRDYLMEIIQHREYYRAGCGLYPNGYENIFQRYYEPNDCYTFYGNGTTYYIDLNYPLEANPIAKVHIGYTTEESSWWIFNSTRYIQNADGYYLSSIDRLYSSSPY